MYAPTEATRRADAYFEQVCIIAEDRSRDRCITRCNVTRANPCAIGVYLGGLTGIRCKKEINEQANAHQNADDHGSDEEANT